MEQVLVSLGIPLIYAVTIVAILWLFRSPLTDLLRKVSDFEFQWGKVKLTLKSKQADLLLESIFEEMQQLINLVPIEERKKVLTLVEARPDQVTVIEIYPDFKRGSKEHKILQNLRDAQFIRPVGGGSWSPEDRIEMKRFGRLMLKFKRDYILPPA